MNFRKVCGDPEAASKMLAAEKVRIERTDLIKEVVQMRADAGARPYCYRLQENPREGMEKRIADTLPEEAMDRNLEKH